ncbi:hypothetical protein LIA77_09829 [Sarocladium implicatum]|nr:hypothetical protein LIA77_09829 [Sarocladium implicatum]
MFTPTTCNAGKSQVVNDVMMQTLPLHHTFDLAGSDQINHTSAVRETNLLSDQMPHYLFSVRSRLEKHQDECKGAPPAPQISHPSNQPTTLHGEGKLSTRSKKSKVTSNHLAPL